MLGKPPAFPGHEVPGKMVGYMPQVRDERHSQSVKHDYYNKGKSLESHIFSLCPQDIALYNEFTISNTLWFFGRIHGLSSKETEARMSFLIDFLDLPQKHSLVKNLR